MKPLLVQSSEVWPPLEEALHAGFTVLKAFPGQAPGNALRQHAEEVEVLVSTSKHGICGELLDTLPNLKMISNFGVGLDNLPLPLLKKRNIQLGFTPDVLTDCVADHAMALAMAACRKLVQADRFIRDAQWPKGAFPLGFRFSGKCLGIIGMGRIGQAVAQRAHGFGMSVGFVNTSPIAGSAHQQFSDVEMLAAWADILIVTVSGSARNMHLIGAKVLSKLGEKGVLVNVSRGSVVDEAALVQALKEGTIACAGLDVFTNEPLVSEDLMSLDNTVLTPHIASSTQETRQAMADLVMQNLDAYFAGKPLSASAF